MLPATLAPDASIDLQMHTTFSDGNWTAEQLLDYVVGEGFALVAITDHDRTDTIAQVQQLGAERRMPMLAAVEMSSEWEGALTDLLCFGVDPERCEALSAIAESTTRRQLENIQNVHAALLSNGYRFPRQDDVLAKSGGEPRQLNDLIALMEAHGYKEQMGNAIRGAGFRWITADLASIVDAAHRGGAVCLIAHPGRNDGYTHYDAPLLDRVRVVAPIDGMEVYHPDHSAEDAAMYVAYTQEHGLLASTGSDSHGPPGQMPIKYPAEISKRLLEHMGIAVRG